MQKFSTLAVWIYKLFFDRKYLWAERYPDVWLTEKHFFFHFYES